jgi:hypothetical protein
MQLYENRGAHTFLSHRLSADGVLGLKDGSFWLVKPEDRDNCRRWYEMDDVTPLWATMKPEVTSTWLECEDYWYRLCHHLAQSSVRAFYLGMKLPERLPDPRNPKAPLPEPKPEPVFDPLAGPVDAWYAERRREEDEARWEEIRAMKLGPGVHWFDEHSRMLIVPMKKKPARRRKQVDLRPERQR